MKLIIYMFKIRASCTEKAEVETGIEKVREFFNDIRNFIELMPNIESIHRDGHGIMHWKIRADIPLVGSMTEKFAVELAEENEERMEWMPLSGEEKNLMHYAADFLEKGGNLTLVQFSQTIELRRRSATQLHLLAGFAGETLISNEMTKRIAEMLKVFIEHAKKRLES